MVRGGSGEFELAGARRGRWALTGAAVTGRQRAAAGQVEGVTASWEGEEPTKGAGKGVKRARGALGEGQDEGSGHLAGRASLPGPGEHLFRRLSVSHQEET